MSARNMYSRLSRSERNGTLVLLTLLLVLTVFKQPICYWLSRHPAPKQCVDYTALLSQIDAARRSQYTYADNKKEPAQMSYYHQAGKLQGYMARPQEQLEVNSADQAAWESLYGIGPVLAARIVEFREGLGGFQRVDQVRDVYGIKPEVYEQIRPRLRIKPAPVRRLNINEADLETLMAHPYIPPTLAKQFVGYRNKVRPFESIEEIKNLYYLRDHPDLFEKLSPYLTVN